MKWQDKGYLLKINRYNENSSIAEFFTEKHGKATGIIFGSTLFQSVRLLEHYQQTIHHVQNVV